MMQTLSRFLNESVLLRPLLLPRTLLYRLFRRFSFRLRRLADSSYFCFFIRHPSQIRLKDYGLLLLAFELSFGLGRFMLNTLTPLRRNMSFLFCIVALLAIGPLDRWQLKHGRKAFALKAPFGFIIASLGFGFVGSFISPPLFNVLLICLALACIFLHSPLSGLCFTMALLSFIPVWSVLLLLLLGILVRVYQRSVLRMSVPPVSGRAFLFLLWCFVWIVHIVLLPQPLSGLPSLVYLLAYPIATDASTRLLRVRLLVFATLGGALCCLFPGALSGTVLLCITVFIGMLP